MNATKIKPNLVSSKTIKRIDKLFSNIKNDEPTWGISMSLFYNDYIKPNLFALIILLIIVIFLSLRYLLKHNKTQRKHKKSRKHKSKKASYKIEYSEPSVELTPQMYSDEDDMSIYERQKYYEEDRNTDEQSIHDLEREYQNTLENNRGHYSPQMLSEIAEDKSTKMSFDEIARIVMGK